MADIVKDGARPVIVEITEHAEIADYEALRAALTRLGPSVSLAVDDAGAGYASLRHIAELRPAMVKLDRSLIAHINDDPSRQAIVAGMRFYAARAGCTLIAEGVETEAERRTLAGIGIRVAQGYLFAKPCPATEAAGAVIATRGPAARRSVVLTLSE
jgi:EAL domain-containing protein (putative c-di-GMP-specific phosphodiesterase class I)